jgi:hypothetical protein
VVAALQKFPTKGSLDQTVPVDPLIYWFHKITQVYGTTLKAIIHEMFGDGIMSAIDVELDVQKKEDPKGDWVVVTMNGEFLPSNESQLRPKRGAMGGSFQPTRSHLGGAITSRRLRLWRLAEIHDSQHRAIVGVELDPSLARHPNGSHAVKPELPADVIVGEGQQGFADWLSICQPEVIEVATNEITEGLGARFHRGGGSKGARKKPEPLLATGSRRPASTKTPSADPG